MIARAKGDAARTTAAFRECREILTQRLVVKPEHARTIAVLAQVDAGLGQKDLALREAQRPCDRARAKTLNHARLHQLRSFETASALDPASRRPSF